MPRIRKAAESALNSDASSRIAAEELLQFVRQAELLSKTYDCVVANPPYMGSKSFISKLKTFAQSNYPNGKSDLFAMFIERCLNYALDNKFVSMVTMQSWMFLSSFESLRNNIISNVSISSMAHVGARGFDSIGGEVVQTTSFVIRNINLNIKACYFRLVNGNSENEKESLLLEAISNRKCGWFFTASSEDFSKIPGSPIAYWVTDTILKIFNNCIFINDIGETKAGLTTGDNTIFQRYWYEVRFSLININATSLEDTFTNYKKWYPCNSGGNFRKYYGNNYTVVNWQNDGEKIRNFCDKNGRLKASPRSSQYYFKEGCTWSKISSGQFSSRYFPKGYIFDDTGQSFFTNNKYDINNAVGILCSKTSAFLLSLFSQTLSFNKGDIARIPLPHNIPNITNNTVTQIQLSKYDWDSYEISWDFRIFPLIDYDISVGALAASFAKFRTRWQSMTDDMRRLEEENNRIFIEAYSLQNELTPDVPLREITLTCNPYYRYGVDAETATEEEKAELENRLRSDTMKELISYALGCMMGRYSLDEPGLIYAEEGGKNFDPDRYKKFPADDDGIIPMLDRFYFEDDFAHRFTEFCRTVWGDETLEENLKFVADNLGPKVGEKPEETIRRWLSTKFFKDWHLKVYKNRPIYWLFSSGKHKAFEALVYLHRIGPNTIARMRSQYIGTLNKYFAGDIERLEKELPALRGAAAKKIEKELDSLRKKQIELRDFDDKLRHYEDLNITLDLDDGVRVNYGKFKDILAEVKTVTGGKND